jgi:large subunit ribosomal protein L3
MAGQTGFQTRVIYNNNILKTGTSLKLNKKRYGNVKTDYLIVSGSVMGPAKRQVVITAPLRESKKQTKKEFEFIDLR